MKTREELTAMSTAQLVELHNEHAEKPVTRFKSKAVAIKRLLAMDESSLPAGGGTSKKGKKSKTPEASKGTRSMYIAKYGTTREQALVDELRTGVRLTRDEIAELLETTPGVASDTLCRIRKFENRRS